MKMINGLLVLAVLLAACAPVPAGKTISGCRSAVDGLSALMSGQEIPNYFLADNPAKKGGEFDVALYFKVLNHLSMQPGYALDYVYHYDGMGGYPILYARPAAQAAYRTEADLKAQGKAPPYLDFVQTDGTPEGFFQLVLLSIMGAQFYLSWHAHYNDAMLICDKAEVTATVAMTDHITGLPMPLKGRLQSRFLQHVEPHVLIGAKTVLVQITTFTQWGGFYRLTYTLQQGFPHTILGTDKLNLVPYDCGVMF